LLRFYVSLFLNARLPAFPLGTFLVNIFGTIIKGMCFNLQHAVGVVAVSNSSATEMSVAVGRLTGCQVLKGVMDGFCGCTTTVSTWVTVREEVDHHYTHFTITT
jgi:fluoride ion exporter CrcB/FEX